MFLIILFIAIIAIAYYNEKYQILPEFACFIGCIIGACAGVMCIGSIVVMLILPFEVAKTKSNYNSMCITIADARANDYISKYERVAVISSIIEMNQTIESHKTFCNSNWVGLWFSKDIANLKYITFSEK